MSGRIVIVGAGFAGVWSALAAKRLINIHSQAEAFKVTVLAPQPSLVMRPRLYEEDPSSMSQDLEPLFKACGIEFIHGSVDDIDVHSHTVSYRSSAGTEHLASYDRLILAAGSSVVRPKQISGLEQHAHDVDSMEGAVKLEVHLNRLGSYPSTTARDTVVVCGAGFTGIELATELLKRLSSIQNPRVILVEAAGVLGPELGPGPRPVITQALEELGIELRLASPITAVDSGGVQLATGEKIETMTTIWTAGVRATPLTQKIHGPKDKLSRLHVDRYLRATSSEHVFATGDAACAASDNDGHYALMSCQHALQLGRVSGYNAAADLLGLPLYEYKQESYNCCLDLGAWGAVITGGWERKVRLTGEPAKQAKMYINQTLIYTPEDCHRAMEAATPVGPDSDELFKQIMEAFKKGLIS
ncbi:hypothetical protein HER10_EVM0012404 [Colletotrichum scovillei]|uniref:FAD/NAD(P)-binding domain-containing protein n=1 Tax=Colletotrichum scovillei TaxID=1209932 RepID=A0A9P7RJW7_9PEZI|nr:uncharacterized protein HER10_EVM0012404 [Colletotrichum scovillei]KAF4780502.1 hypothetical protein HER10_EVM0012404 [Colletotrichum scovillei]KAG7058558.1 FAD/NAD(P)-binding domain-containing protein [Colletotrichum scovillei]KAG7077161.1 FAD/NAD(P)-binding domain-containing protein [Colletotrichum scovillei]KAG7084271.1 FAD/NAD(P)-binding domain-containing protein [Colletotrichum scovillei]